MSKKCAVCEEGKGPEICEICGFTDDGVINDADRFINKEDAEYWLETVVKPYRERWEARKREAERLTQKVVPSVQSSVPNYYAQQRTVPYSNTPIYRKKKISIDSVKGILLEPYILAIVIVSVIMLVVLPDFGKSIVNVLYSIKHSMEPTRQTGWSRFISGVIVCCIGGGITGVTFTIFKSNKIIRFLAASTLMILLPTTFLLLSRWMIWACIGGAVILSMIPFIIIHYNMEEKFFILQLLSLSLFMGPVGLLVKYVETYGTNTVAYSKRGAVYQQKDLYDEAIREYNEAIRLDSKYALAYVSRGNVYLMKNQYDDAIMDLSEAIRLDPKYALAYANRGNVYRVKNQYDDAIRDLTEAIRLDSKNASAYARRGDVYRLKDQYDDAIRDLTKAIKLDSKYAFAYASRGETYRMKGQYDDAIRDLTEAIGLNPKDVFAYTFRGETYRMKSQYDDAIKDLSEAIRLDPKYASAYARRGQAYRQLGNRDQAIRDFENALALNPDLDWVKKELKEVRGK